MHKKLKDSFIDHMYSTMQVCVLECIKMCELANVRSSVKRHVAEWAWQEHGKYESFTTRLEKDDAISLQISIYDI